jgi:hypothetical protein
MISVETDQGKTRKEVAPSKSLKCEPHNKRNSPTRNESLWGWVFNRAHRVRPQRKEMLAFRRAAFRRVAVTVRRPTLRAQSTECALAQRNMNRTLQSLKCEIEPALHAAAHPLHCMCNTIPLTHSPMFCFSCLQARCNSRCTNHASQSRSVCTRESRLACP